MHYELSHHQQALMEQARYHDRLICSKVGAEKIGKFLELVLQEVTEYWDLIRKCKMIAQEGVSQTGVEMLANSRFFQIKKYLSDVLDKSSTFDSHEP